MNTVNRWIKALFGVGVITLFLLPVWAQTNENAAPAASGATTATAPAAPTSSVAPVASPVTSAPAENTAPVETKDSKEGIRLNFRDAPLETVLDYLSKEAGFVIVRGDTAISGKVDVWSHQPLTKDEAVELLNTVLNQKGYAAIRNGRTLILVPKSEAARRELPVKVGREPEAIEPSDTMVTQIIPVRYTNATKLIENLQQLLPTDAVMSANDMSNAIVLTSTQATVRRMTEIIQALDTSLSTISTIRIFKLQNADATDAANVVNKLFDQSTSRTSSGGGQGGPSGSPMSRFMGGMMGSRGGGPGGSQGGATSNSNAALQASARVLAVADTRTNPIVVSAPDDAIDMITKVVEELDQTAAAYRQVQVFPLSHANAEEMATVLEGVFNGTQANSGQRSMAFMRMGGPGGPGGFGGGASSSSSATNQITAKADVRTNSVVVSAEPEVMSQVEEMIKSLDSSTAKDKKVFVYNLENADPESVATIIQDMYSTGSTGTSNRLRTNSQSQGTSRSASGSGNRASGNRSNSGGSSFGGSSGGFGGSGGGFGSLSGN